MPRKFAIACNVLFVLISAGGLYAAMIHLGWHIKAHEAKSMTNSHSIVDDLKSNGYLTIVESDPEYQTLIIDIADIADTSMHIDGLDFMAHLWLALAGGIGCILCIVGFCLSFDADSQRQSLSPLSTSRSS